MKQADAIKASVKRDIAGLDQQLDRVLDRIVETNNVSVITACEKKIAKLERDKLILTDKLDRNTKPKHTLDEIFEPSMVFLSSPWSI